MHRFQPSRGRIFFEVLCAVGIAASCGGAWIQTGASALLAAAAVSTLYGLVHFFDLFRHEPSAVVEPQRIELEPDAEAELPVRQSVSTQLARIEEQLTAYSAVEEAPVVEPTSAEQAQPVEPIVPPPGESRRTKAPRKASSRRASPTRKAKAAEPELVEKEEAGNVALRDEQAANGPTSADEQFHPPVAPLFEPEPFVRQQQRAMFGRKSG